MSSAAPGGAPPGAALIDVAYLGTSVRGFAGRPRSLSALLSTAAQRWPGRTALVTPSGTRDYRGLDAAVDAAAAGLAGLGIGPGDRFAVALGSDLPMAVAPFVASRLGATVLLLNTSLSPPQWVAPLVVAGCRLLVAEADTERAAKAAAAEAGLEVVDVGAALTVDGDGGHRAAVSADEDHPVALIATSGTTGVPKITMVTSRGLLHAALGYVELLGLDGDDRTLVVLPLSTIGPLSAQLTAMPLVGGTVVIPADPSPAAAGRVMAEHAITHLDAVPAWLTLFARQPDQPVLPAWRTLIYGGAPMPPETAAALGRRYPGCARYDVWGLSETSGPATAVRLDPGQTPPAGLVGRPLAGVEVQAVDLLGAPQPPGVVGELRVRGANVTPGYLGDPDTTAAVLRDGWLRTGDLGTVAADGDVRVLDRAKDVILRGGNNVFSVEVEQVLGEAPGVLEAAVFGVADELGGEAVAAVVVLAPGHRLDAPALRRRVREVIGVHAVPRRLAVVALLPRNANGKVDKRRLRGELA